MTKVTGRRRIIWVGMKVRSIIFFLLLGAGPVLGDTVYMLDGTIREGLVETRNETELRIRIQREGISGTLVIPMSQISRAVINHRMPTGLSPTSVMPPIMPPLAASMPAQVGLSDLFSDA